MTKGDCFKSKGAYSEAGFPFSGGKGEAGSRMIRAVTEIDSGRDRTGGIMGTGLLSKVLTRFLIDLDLSRSVNASGEDSRDASVKSPGEGVFLFKEFVRSAMDGEVPRPLLFRTEKKAGAAPGGGPVVGAAAAPGVVVAFSKAFILWEIPEPRLTFLITGLSASWLILFKNAADADTAREVSNFGGTPSNEESSFLPVGFDTTRETLLRQLSLFLGLVVGNTGVIGDFETEIGCASCTTAKSSSSIRSSSEEKFASVVWPLWSVKSRSVRMCSMLLRFFRFLDGVPSFSWSLSVNDLLVSAENVLPTGDS